MGKHYGHVTIEERCEIARLRASGLSVREVAASMDRSPSTVARELKRNGSKTQGYKPMPGGGAVLGWNGMAHCATRSYPDSSKVGHRSRCRVDWLWSQAIQSSPTRASTGSSTARWPVRRTTAGASICPGPSRSGGGEAAEAAAQPPSWLCVAPSPNALSLSLIAALQATGGPT